MKKRRSQIVQIVVRGSIAVGVLATAFSILAYFVTSKPVPARRDTTLILAKVAVLEIREVPIRRQWTGYGTARARNAADVPARVSSTVVELGPDVVAGSTIEPGALIVRLDDADFAQQSKIARDSTDDLDAQLERLDIEQKSWQRRFDLAKEQVTLAEEDYARVLEAKRRNSANQRELDQSRQAVIAAIRDETRTHEELDKIGPARLSLTARRNAQVASHELARLNVARSTITCPRFGTERAGAIMLQMVDVEIGENVATGQRVARVVDLALMEVVLRLPASARPHVGVGDPVEMYATGDGGQRWDAVVTRVAPENDERTRTMTLFVEIGQNPGDTALLAPGQFVRGQVSSSRSRRVTPVPRRSIDGDHVLLVNKEGVIRLQRAK